MVDHPDDKLSDAKVETLERAFYRTIREGLRKDAPYDGIVLFSGGKDSMYVAHKLKQAGSGRVCLFTVDNGVEEDRFYAHVKDSAAKLGCDLYVHQPPGDRFARLYRFAITEPSLREIDPNPLCFFCGRYIMALGVSFAEKMNAPFVFYGATPEQVNRGQKAVTPRDIRIFEMVSKRVFLDYYRKMQSLEQYKEDPMIKGIIDRIFYTSDTVKLMFPFQYLPYHVERIKRTLEDAYGWENPVQGLDNEQYLTSGCRMVSLFGVLAKGFGFAPHELEQFQKHYENGIVSEEAYRFNRDLLEDIMQAEITPEMETLAERIGLKEQLLSQKDKRTD